MPNLDSRNHLIDLNYSGSKQSLLSELRNLKRNINCALKCIEDGDTAIDRHLITNAEQITAYIAVYNLTLQLKMMYPNKDNAASSK
ncbi:MAG TPA: hypothetical protein VIE65_07290 [Methylobacter sp.]|jgi:hypothetical protein